MSNYWKRRAAENMWEYMEDAERTAEEIAKLYRRGYSYLSSAIRDIYERFRDNHHLTDEQARELLNTMQNPPDIDELRRKLKETKGDAAKSELLAKLESAAYQHRVLRLKEVQKQIDTIMTGIYKQELLLSEKAYTDLIQDVYYKSIFETQKQTGLAFSFSLVDPDAIDKALHSKWSGKNYSERIWDNTQELAEKLKEELLVNLMTGRTNREAAEAIALQTGKGIQNARRLVRTESNFLANQMEIESYKECEITHYRFLATLDLRTSKACRELDGKVFPVSEQQPGKNCPPMHPYCRSTTICEISPEELTRMKRLARNQETGKTEKVPADMTYQEWYQKKVKGHPEAELNERMIQNRSLDRKQFERYKDVLEKDVPETLDEFQRMKYTDSERWDFAKLDYERRNKLIKNPELKLPDAENAVLPDGKFTQYLLDGSNEKGLAKGRAFTSRLGYDKGNWQELQREIAQRAVKYPAEQKGMTEFGVKYEQRMILYGKKGTPANVIVGWMQKPNGIMNMTSAYIKEVK